MGAEENNMHRGELLPRRTIQRPEKIDFKRRCPNCAALHDRSEIRSGRCFKCGVPFQEAKPEELFPFVIVTLRGAVHTVRARSMKQVELVLRLKGYRYQSLKKGAAK